MHEAHVTDAPKIEAETRDERLPKVERLTRRAQFLKTQRSGKRHSYGPFVIYAAKNQLGFNRIGLTTSRKVGNAVVRNRWRRLCREAFRRNKHALDQGFDLVIIVRSKQAPMLYDDVERLLVKCASSAIARYAPRPKH